MGRSVFKGIKYKFFNHSIICHANCQNNKSMVASKIIKEHRVNKGIMTLGFESVFKVLLYTVVALIHILYITYSTLQLIISLFCLSDVTSVYLNKCPLLPPQLVQPSTQCSIFDFMHVTQTHFVPG